MLFVLRLRNQESPSTMLSAYLPSCETYLAFPYLPYLLFCLV